MYVGFRHTAAHETTVDANFGCAPCGFRSPVRIRTKGYGQGMAHYGIGNESAHIAAQVQAVRSAQKSARMVWEVLACPRCGARSDNGKGTLRRWVVLPLVILASSLMVVTAFFLTVAHYGAKGDPIPAALNPLVFLTLAAFPGVIGSTLFFLIRSRAVLKLRREANQHAEFVA